MKLSETKTFTNEYDPRIYAIYSCLLFFREHYNLPEKYNKALTVLIDVCENDIFKPLPTKRDVELFEEKHYVKTIYKEVL